MESYAGIVKCEKCRASLLLKDEDVEKVVQKGVRVVDEVTDTYSFHVFTTTCPQCNYVSIIDRGSLSITSTK